jgi:hypothetical protein
VLKKEVKYFVLNNSLLNPTDATTSTTTNQVTRRVELHTVIVERGLSWENAMEMYASSLHEPQGFYLSNQIKNNHRIAIFALYQPKTNEFGIYRPNTGLQVRQETLETLGKKYKRVIYDLSLRVSSDQNFYFFLFLSKGIAVRSQAALGRTVLQVCDRMHACLQTGHVCKHTDM